MSGGGWHTRSGGAPTKWVRTRWLRWGLWAVGGPLLSLGCQTTPTAQIAPSVPPATVPVLNQSLQPAASKPASELQQTAYHPDGPAQLPPAVEAAAPPVEPGQPLPIDLDAVFRLAEDQNPKIGQSRAKVHESQMQGMAGMAGWMPRMTAGMAYYRHEGGIQNPDGTFVNSSTGAFYPGLDLRSELDVKDKIAQRINAERNQWQQKGELSQITTDVLLEAATTYIDLLTARRAEAVSREMEKLAAPMLKRAEDLKNNDRSYTVLYESILAETTMRKQAIVKLKQQGDLAAFKLAYLLSLPCDVPLVPVDQPGPISLVDVSVPTCKLVAQALATGPGVQELEGMLASIQVGQAQLESPISLLPMLQVNLFEGPFAAGTGSNLTWSNRFDAGVQARWDITALLGARQQQALAKNRLMQLHLNQQELANKLTAGVQEACTTIAGTREQMALGMSAIQHASETHRLQELRVKESVMEAKPTDVTQSIRALEQAHHDFLSALSAHNKAQIRLLLLMGPQGKGPPPPPPSH